MKYDEIILDYHGRNTGLINLIYIGYIPEGDTELAVDYKYISSDEVKQIQVNGRLLYVDYMHRVMEENDPTCGYEYMMGDRQYHPSITAMEKCYYEQTGYGCTSIETHVGAYP